jgi:hypothetical protein
MKKTKKPTTIEVCQRLMDHHLVPQFKNGKFIQMVEAPKYHAKLATGAWAAGVSIDDAIGSLVRCHPEAFGVQIKFLGKLPR